jgi:hypothetical protein
LEVYLLSRNIHGVRTTAINLSQDNRCLDRDSIRIPPKYKLEALPLEPHSSVGKTAGSEVGWNALVHRWAIQIYVDKYIKNQSILLLWFYEEKIVNCINSD